jgi:hypothetical protein
MANLSKTQKTLLKAVESAGASELGYLETDNSADLNALKAAGLIDIGSLGEGKTQVAARMVPNGAVKPNGAAGAAGAETVAAGPAAKYPLAAGIPIAPALKGGSKKEEYPFSLMQIGDSFLVPVSDEFPEPWKSFASTVSSATRRFATKSGEMRKTKEGKDVPKLIPTRKFTMRRVRKNDAYPNGYTELSDGARVFRTA